MRTLIILAAIVVVLALVGWVSFGHGPNRSSINIETDEIRRDADEALERTEEAIEAGKREFSDVLRDQEDDVDDIGDQDVDALPADDEDVGAQREQVRQ
jgi:hypothetical protein